MLKVNTFKISLLSILIVGMTAVSCKKKGCTDANATNYESKAKKDDGSCVLKAVTSTSTPSVKEQISDHRWILTKYKVDNMQCSDDSMLPGGTEENLTDSTKYYEFDLDGGVRYTYPTGSDLYAWSIVDSSGYLMVDGTPNEIIILGENNFAYESRTKDEDCNSGVQYTVKRWEFRK